MKYIFYKNKVSGPFELVDQEWINAWKKMVDGGFVAAVPDTPFLNDDMKNNPNDAFILFQSPVAGTDYFDPTNTIHVNEK
jgi:hypothetical protein